MRSSLNSTQRYLLSFLSAVLVWFSFPNFFDLSLAPSTAFIGWIALIPFFLGLEGISIRQSAAQSWFFGFAQFGGVLYWIGLIEAAKALSWLGWFALVFYLSLYFLVFGLGVALLKNHRWKPVAAAILWVALEYIRGSRPWGGFSWAELGYSQAPYPALLTATQWSGVYGLTFLMVWFNGSIAQAISAMMKGDRKVVGTFGLPLAVLALIVGYGSWTSSHAALVMKGKVALLQPSIPQDEKWSKTKEVETYEKLGNLVETIQGSRPDLIVWPETAAPDFLSWTPDPLRRVEEIVQASRTFNLVGCLDAEKGLSDPKTRSYNAAMLFDPSGKPIGVYHKRHLVPFGEFVPFQKQLTFLGPVVGDLGNFDRGEHYEKFQTNGFNFTPMICYEVIFPGDVQKAFQTGAEALVNISNDAWYGRTASAYQHAQMAIVRAAEQHKPLFRSSNAGLCLATDPFGRLLSCTKLFEVRILMSDVFLVEEGPTFYARFGNWFPKLCWALIFLWFVVGRLQGKKEPRS